MIHRDVDIFQLDEWARRAVIDLNAYLQAARDAGSSGVSSTRMLVNDYQGMIACGAVDPVPELDGE